MYVRMHISALSTVKFAPNVFLDQNSYVDLPETLEQIEKYEEIFKLGAPNDIFRVRALFITHS